MALYTSIYPSLKAEDPTNAAAIVAAAIQAAEWESGMVARFCALIQADPVEVDQIVRQARAARDVGVQWFVQP